MSPQVGVSDLDVFVRLERQVWDALTSGDADADRALLSEDFLGVYPSGFSDRGEHVGQLDDGPTIADYEISSPQLMMLAADHAVLSYAARYRRPGVDRHDTMYITSIWSRRSDGWVNVFSQDTPADEPQDQGQPAVSAATS